MLPGLAPTLFSSAAPPDLYTKLLLHCDGTTGALNFVDASPAQRGPASVNFNAIASTAQKKFGNSSLYVTEGANIQFPSHADFEFGSGDFTIDFWVYRVNGNSGIMIGRDYTATGYNPWMIGMVVGGNDVGYGSSNGASWDLLPTCSFGAVVINSWQHLAITRSGNTFRTFRNGIQQATWTVAAGLAFMANSGPLTIGWVPAYAAHYGYLDEIRISKGIARWTANFTPPAAPYAPVDSVPIYTKLLLHCDGANGSTTFTDSSQAGRAATVFGNAKIVTAQSQFGGSSAYFDGSGDYITFPSHIDLDFGYADFTIDWWERRVSNANTIACRDASVGDYPSWVVGFGYSGLEYFFTSNADNSDWAVSFLSQGTFVANAWHHMAVVRKGDTFYAYRNGIQVASVVNKSGIKPTSNPLAIGVGRLAYAEYCNAYIDEFRISKGIARWTANFTPPAAPYSPD
jgi:hypothetical protein